MNKILGLSAIVLVAACQVACNAPSEGEDAPKPPVAFDGQKDPRFVGVWKVTKGDTSYTFAKDGAFSLKGTVMNHGQKFPLNTSGTWLVKGDRFLIKDGQGNVAQYAYKLNGDKLTLSSTGSMKMDTTMVRSKASS